MNIKKNNSKKLLDSGFWILDTHPRILDTGFTLIELLIVIALIAIIGLVLFLMLGGRRNEGDLTSTALQIAATLREAQSRSVAEDQNAAWGVHFSNATATAPYYALFSSAYAQSTTAGYYRLPASVAFASSTLAVGSSVDILFSGLSGIASVSTSIGVVSISQPSLSSTVKVANSGAVSL